MRYIIFSNEFVFANELIFNNERVVTDMDVIDKIDALRKERGWSINNLAMEAMLTQSTVNNIFTRRNEPKLSTLRAICEALGTTLSEFFADETSQNETDGELIRRVRTLDADGKCALLALLKSMNK